MTTPVLGVLVNTLQYHDTVEFVQDSETEDPQLVAELASGSKPWQDNGKELMRRQQWDRGLDRIHLQVFQRQHRRTHTDNGNAIFDSGKRLHRCRRTGKEDESRTAAEVVMDDALMQDDGIELIVDELDRCWEVTQDQDKASKIEKGPSTRHKGTSKWKRPSCPTWHGGSSNFQQLENALGTPLPAVIKGYATLRDAKLAESSYDKVVMWTRWQLRPRRRRASTGAVRPP